MVAYRRRARDVERVPEADDGDVKQGCGDDERGDEREAKQPAGRPGQVLPPGIREGIGDPHEGMRSDYPAIVRPPLTLNT